MGKAPGIDNIAAEEIVAQDEAGVFIYFKLFGEIWYQEQVPEDWQRAEFVPIFKRKDITDCDNYRGSRLLRHSELIFACVLLQRIKARTEEMLSESCAGYSSGRSTIDQLYTLQSIAENYLDHGTALYECYIDFRKGFDSVWREGLWKVMMFYGYPEKIVRLLENLYQETFSAVRVDGCLTHWFCMPMGVLQGCVLSQILFSILL